MSAKRATSDAMEEMHKAVVEGLTDVIKNGEVDPDTGARKRASPAYYSCAIKMLKDNHIAGVISENSPLKNLLDSLGDSDILAELENPSVRH